MIGTATYYITREVEHITKLVEYGIPSLISITVSSLIIRYFRSHPVVEILAIVCSNIVIFWLMNALPWQLRGNSDLEK